jgi:hypothetical protein
VRGLLRPSRLVLIACAVSIAVVPALRREFVWNLRALGAAIPCWPRSDYAMSLVGKELSPGIGQYDPRQELENFPRDLEIRIALAADFLNGPPGAVSERALREALKLAPRSPVVLSIAALRDVGTSRLEFHREEQLSGRRSDREKYGPRIREKRLTPGQVKTALKRLDAWAAADPHNAAPDVFAAYVLLGAKRDAEALARAEAASSRRYFTLHGLAVTGAKVHEMVLQGVPAPDAEIQASELALFFRPGAVVRDLARMMSAIGWDQFEAGHQAKAFRYWTAAGRIGTLMMARERETLIVRMVGIAVQGIGYWPVYRPVHGGRAGGASRRASIRRGGAYEAFAAARGERAARGIFDEVAARQSLADDFGAAVLVGDRVAASWYRYWFGRAVAVAAMPAALFGALLCLAALALGRRLKPTLSRLWSGIFVAAAICMTLGGVSVSTAAAVLGLMGCDPVADSFRGLPLQLPGSPWLGLALAFGAPAFLVLMVAIAGLWLTRKEQVTYSAAVGGAMRQSLLTLLAVLALVWVISTAAAVREGGICARYLARGRKVGELRMLQGFAADQGIHLKRR